MSVHGARLARARRELIKHLKDAGATRDETAVPLEPEDSLERAMFKRMLRRGVIRTGMKGGYWLDEERYADWKRQQLLFVVGILLVMFSIMACLIVYEPRHAEHRIDVAPADSVSQARP